MIDPDKYLTEDLSISEIEGPAEFYDWEAEEYIVNHMYDWKDNLGNLIKEAIDSAPADDLGDVLVELEADDLTSW